MELYNETPRILVTGSTGVLGRAVCEVLDSNSAAYTGSSRQKEKLKKNSKLLDMSTGEGLPEILDGVRTILHLASDKTKPDNDVKGMRLILSKIKELKTQPHFVYISIVGTDLLDLPYFREKLAAELLLKSSGIPFTILRATQFYEYLDQVFNSMLKYGIGLLPKKAPIQPIDVRVVSERLFEIIKHDPTNTIEEIGGKTTFKLERAIDRWLAAQNRGAVILDIPAWGKALKNLRDGALVSPQPTCKGISWEDWLERRYILR